MSIKFVLVIHILFAICILTVCAQSSEKNTLELSDHHCKDLSCNDMPVNDNIKILFTTHYDILEIEVNENFTQNNNSRKIRINLSDPTEIYYSSKGNYIVYETIGYLYAYPLDMKKPNNLGIMNPILLPLTLKAKSQLNIDWIHDLFYWIKDKKKIVVGDITSLKQPIVVANKIYDSIKFLVVNPIDSFIIWLEFDNEDYKNVLFKSSQDGSDPSEIFETKTFIKRLIIDYRTKRIFYLSVQLYSIDYNGNDKQLIISQSMSISQFEVLGNYIYWTEYNSNQFFRENFSQVQTTPKSLNLTININRFQIIDYWRQPNGTNRCENSNCSELCLPVDGKHFRCVCHNQSCADNLNLQIVNQSRINLVEDEPHTHFQTHTNQKQTTHLSQTSTTLTTINHLVKVKPFNTSTSTLPQNVTSFTSIMHNFSHQIHDNNIFPSINVTDMDRDLNTTEIYNYKNQTLVQNNTLNETHIDKTLLSNLSSTLQTIINVNLTELPISEIDMYRDKEYHLTTNKNVNESSEKHLKIEDIDQNLKFVSINRTTEKTMETPNITDEVIVSESKEYEDIRISWYNLLKFGAIIFIVGTTVGTVLSTITIKIYGKQNREISYNTNSRNKWDTVGFEKSEGNIYFGAKYRVKDESLY